jgi:hypothetical protein
MIAGGYVHVRPSPTRLRQSRLYVKFSVHMVDCDRKSRFLSSIV